MMSGLSLTSTESGFIGLIFEGFFYGKTIWSIPFLVSAKVFRHYTGDLGIYSAIFFMYLQYQVSQRSKSAEKRPIIIIYSLFILYVLSVALLAADILAELVPNVSKILPVTI